MTKTPQIPDTLANTAHLSGAELQWFAVWTTSSSTTDGTKQRHRTSGDRSSRTGASSEALVRRRKHGASRRDRAERVPRVRLGREEVGDADACASLAVARSRRPTERNIAVRNRLSHTEHPGTDNSVVVTASEWAYFWDEEERKVSRTTSNHRRVEAADYVPHSILTRAEWQRYMINRETRDLR